MPQNAQSFFNRHRETLEKAVAAIDSREYWTPYPESLKQYSEDAVKAAPQRFEALLRQPFALRKTRRWPVRSVPRSRPTGSSWVSPMTSRSRPR